MTYRLLYQAIPKPDGIERADIPEGFGACDALVIASILYPPDGSISVQLVNHDGRTGKPLADDELFKVWTFMAKHLSESTQISDGKRQVAALLFDMVRKAVLASQGK